MKSVVYIFAKQGKHPQADRSLVKAVLSDHGAQIPVCHPI